MANTNTPFGLAPVSSSGGTIRCNPYAILPGATAIYKNDPMTFDSTGAASGLAAVTIATAGGTNAIMGSVQAIFNSSGQAVNYYPAGSATGYTCMIADHPDQEFMIQEDSDGGAIAQASIGLNVSLVAGSGNTTTGISGWMADSSTVHTTSTHQLKILRLAERPIDNTLAESYAKWIVKINNHQLGSHTGTAGV